jgi:hypothetical protein
VLLKAETSTRGETAEMDDDDDDAVASRIMSCDCDVDLCRVFGDLRFGSKKQQTDARNPSDLKKTGVDVWAPGSKILSIRLHVQYGSTY